MLDYNNIGGNAFTTNNITSSALTQQSCSRFTVGVNVFPGPRTPEDAAGAGPSERNCGQPTEKKPGVQVGTGRTRARASNGCKFSALGTINNIVM